MIGLYKFNRLKSYSFLCTFVFISALDNLSAQNVYINEFLASNVTTNPDIVDFDDYSDWFEIYNAESSPVDLSGYFLTDNLNIPTKWQIPEGCIIAAKGFLRFWADGEDDKPGSLHTRTSEPFNTFITRWYHTNFKLSVGGEEIGLFDSQENLIDSIIYGLQNSDVSYGRKPDGSNNWFYFGEPTPAEPNNNQGVEQVEFSTEPEFSVEGGLYVNEQNLTLTNNSNEEEIRFTSDGSKPTSTSTLYTSSISISATTVIRARSFDKNKLPSKVISQSYIINESPTLPVLSISVYPETFWDNQIGIYENSMKGREIPVTFELYELDGNQSINYDGGLRISGQGSYNYPQKPFTLSADDRFGYEIFDYKFFPDRNINEYSEIYLRNSGTPDNRRTMFRDALQHSLVIDQMDIDCQAYRPVMSFINGEYWGIYNLREKLNTNYLASHHNVDPTNIDYLETDFSLIPVEIEGNADDYNQLLSYIKNNDLSREENYNYVKSHIDINEYLNYVITEIYCDNINWLNTNVRWWRERSEKGKWRWILVDLDWGFGTDFPGFSSNFTNNTIEMATSAPGSELELYPWATELFSNLLDNTEFKNEFIQRFAGYLNTTFSSERVLNIADSIKKQIGTEMIRHIEKWSDYTDVYYDDPPIMNISEWNADVEIMRLFALERPAYQRNHIIDFFGLSGQANLTVNNSNPASGKVIINTVNIPNNFTGMYFKDIPISIKAVPNIGYRFLKWEGISNSVQDSIEIILENNSTISAVFEPNNVSIIPSQIFADTELKKSDSPYYSKTDINITNGTTLTIEPGVEIIMAENTSINVYGGLKINGSKAEPIIISPNESSGMKEWGAICFLNATETSELAHLRLIGATHGSIRNDFKAAISSYESDLILDNIEIQDAPFPIFIQYGNVELSNSHLHSEKTTDLINVKFAESALIENCLFRGNNSYDTDAIDYDGLNNGIIRGNRIYNFFGENSDGIDLGEGSKNILIENNLIYNCFDKGISVGQASTTEIRNNVIVNCAQGVGVKDESSFAAIDKTTFYGNKYAVASFEKNFGAGGGNAAVKNSILSNSTINTYLLDDLSSLLINYSLSDTEELPGIGNIFADPLFQNNYLLSESSPAINSGDPSSPTDMDGSRADIGSFEFVSSKDENIIFNEIHFNPNNGEEFEFVELFNNSSSSINLSGYKIRGGIEFDFPVGTNINSRECIIIAKNMGNHNNNGYKVFEWEGNQLSNYWSDLELYNNAGDLVDYVSYSILQGGTEYANGFGPSLELKDPQLENMYYNNWRTSFNTGGSPGEKNEVQEIKDLYLNEIMAMNTSSYHDENGDFDDWIEIYNASENTIDLGGFYISDRLADTSFYEIPTDNPKITNIEPKGQLILWADEETTEGANHLNFKLSGIGESVYLAQKIDNQFIVIDSVKYQDQIEDVSYGRLEDGFGEWNYTSFATPEKPNSIDSIFNKGILLVNGVSIVYGEEILNAYFNKAFWGKFPVTFWDCFDLSFVEYPETVPEAIGHGALSFEELSKYSTVIWVGNNYAGDLDYWKLSEVKSYVEAGGNLLLLSRFGQSFIDEDLMKYLGIKWVENKGIAINNCIPAFQGLDTISVTGNQSLNDIFDVNVIGEESTLLFTETVSFNEPRGLGVWKKPLKGGAYRKDGGQMVFISGRPYRYDSFDLRKNIEYILENFFGESEFPIIDTTETLVDIYYKLYQNYPNPFNPTTTIYYDLEKDSKVELTIYNILGQKVKTLVNEIQPFGRKSIVWDGFNNSGNLVTSGVYIYSIKVGDWIKNKKMVFLK